LNFGIVTWMISNHALYLKAGGIVGHIPVGKSSGINLLRLYHEMVDPLDEIDRWATPFLHLDNWSLLNVKLSEEPRSQKRSMTKEWIVFFDIFFDVRRK
jgi:hypothetical protein